MAATSCTRSQRCRSDVRRSSHARAAAKATLATPAKPPRPQWTNSPLHVAVHEGNTGQVSALLQTRSAPVDFETLDGQTPLHFAATLGRLEVARVLVRHGASLEARDQFDCTALHCAAPHAAVVEMLLEAGARTSVANAHGDQPLHAAAYAGDAAALRLLIKADVDVATTGHNGTTALAVAAVRGNLNAVRYLIEQGGAAVDATDAHGLTPLHAAATAGRREVVECLLFHRAQPTGAVAEALHAAQAATESERRSRAELASSLEGLSPRWVERVTRMPPLTRRLLALDEPVIQVEASHLLIEQATGRQACIDTLSKYRGAVAALSLPRDAAVLSCRAALSPAACAALRRAVDVSGTKSVDSVDQVCSWLRGWLRPTTRWLL